MQSTTKFTIFGSLVLVLFSAFANQSAFAQRVTFNSDWKFSKGDFDSASTNDFDDSQWRTVELPHDWAIEGPFDVKYNARAGGLPFHGVGWYRKTFQMSEQAKGNQTVVEFDGAMNNSTVWINGHKLGDRPYGYVGFEYDLTPHLKFDGTKNVISVRLAPEDLSSRWYPGAGIYRNVYLETRNPVHVAHWGTFIRTPDVSTDAAKVELDVTVENSSDASQAIVVSTEIKDPQGNLVATMSEPCEVPAGEKSAVTLTATISNPRLWDLETPVRYNARTSIIAENESGRVTLDNDDTPFGLRSIEFNATQGFLLNGRVVKIQGVCNHHDLGPLGAAVNRRATQRQIEIMKSMGVNSIRTSHNPPSPELVELCDEMGVLLQVEAFDCWVMDKVPNGYNKYFEEWHDRDLRDMIRRDRNSPSVIMWSIGNEILEQGNKETGAGWAKTLTAICKDEDPTRKVTAGFNYYPASVENGLAAEIDLVGLNYKPAYYSELLKQHPDWIVYGSETASTVSSRGVYHLPQEKYKSHPSLQVTSYDFIGPPWAYPPEVEFDALAKNPQMFGEYIWTGFDYLGEPTPYGGKDNSTNGYWNDDWPAHGSYFGAVDLAGFPKDRFYLYQSQWTTAPMVHVLPHWNWEGKEGQIIPVIAYTNCEEVELFLNGKSLGRQKKGEKPVAVPVKYNGWEGGETLASKYRIGWDVPYEPGELTVRAYRNGAEVATKTVRTAGKPARLRLQPDRQTIHGDGDDLSFVTVQVVDENGNFCPLADSELTFEVEGAGKLEALGSGNPISLELFQSDKRKAFNGLALAIVRSKRNHSGSIVLKVSADQIPAANIVLESTVVPSR